MWERARKVRFVGGGVALGAIAGVIFFETHPAIPHFRLITFVLVFLCLSALTVLVAERFRSPFLIASSLAFGLAAAEAVAAVMEPKDDLSVTENYEIDAPILGWDNGPAGVYHARRIDPKSGAVLYEVDYTIDAHHDRVTRAAVTDRTVSFFGESFTFGDGVKDADAMPQKFADLLDGKQRVVNVAVSGYSPAQVLRELETGMKDDVIGRDPAAFVMLTGSFHVVRTACRESWTIPAPRYNFKNGRLAYVGDCAEGLARIMRTFLEHAAAYRVFIKPYRLRVSRHDIETFIEIVARTAAVAREKYGVELIVPYVGGPVSAPKSLRDKQAKLLPIWAYLPGTGYDDDSILAALRKRGVKVFDVTLRDEAMRGEVIGIPGDGHPTPYANARRAEMTLNQLRSIGIPLAGLENDTQKRGAAR